jgi:hypothetical protein
MTARSGPIHEVTLFVDRDVATDCDQWLEDHVREALRDASVTDCNVFSIASDNDNRVGRGCQAVLEIDADLDEYLDGPAADMEAALLSQFGDKIDIHSRILREDQTQHLPPSESPDCLNCGNHLRGQYCGHCGQRSRSRLISLWELISDAFGDLFELDSRIWQTVVPLLTRPGRLTRDYLKGRRARFMPPFRMYLVMSVIFFVVAFFDPREELGLFFEPQTEAEIAAESEQFVTENNIVIFPEDEDEQIDDEEEDCNIEADNMEDLPLWLARRLTVERLTQVCERIVADSGKSLSAKVIDSTPAALIVLLPLMALVLKALYPLSRRYYVEHLLFFVHFHAFVFLLLTLELLLTRLATLLGAPEIVSVLTIVAMSIYIFSYVFVAMRRVYEQGRIVTFLKFITLLVAYVTGFSIIISVTALLALFSI